MQLILASNSPRRQAILTRIGIRISELADPGLDEQLIQGEPAHKAVMRLARMKAESVQSRYPQSAILAGDTLVALGRRIFGKPDNVAEARTMLAALSGRSHRVYGAISLITPNGKAFTRSCESRILFKRLHPDEIEAYIRANEWQGRAGACAIDGQGACFIKKIIGCPSNVEGMSIHILYQMLIGAGLSELISWRQA